MSLTSAQIAALEQLATGLASIFNPAAGAAVAAIEGIANATIPALQKVSAAPVGSVPAGAVKSVVAAADVHPVLVSQGLAPLTAAPVDSGALPAEDDMNLPDIYSRLAAVEQKVNALVAATGLVGSAAMAAHA